MPAAPIAARVVEWGNFCLSESPVRFPLVALVLTSALAVAWPAAHAAPAKPAPKATPRPAPTVPPAITEQLTVLKGLGSAQLRPAYAEAQLELARRYQAAGLSREAIAAAKAASSAFDRQVEIHKTLSEQLTPYERARAVRAVAHDLGVKRDRANFYVAELARASGDDDTAITHYVLVIESQPDQPLGQDALAALVAMGVVAPAPSPKP